MSLISASESSILAWDTLQDTTTELRSGCLALEQSLQEIFREVEQMRVELVDRILEVEAERRRLDVCQEEIGAQSDVAQRLTVELSEREAELAQREAELEEARRELRRAQEELQQERDELTAAVDESDSELRCELESLRAQQQSLQAELDALRKQRDAWQQQAATPLARPGASSGETDSTSPRRTHRTSRAAAVTMPVLPAAEDTRTISAAQFSALQQERAALEAELELVRNRAAELNETVSLQQREIAEQKTELSHELQQLRRLVEKQADLIADQVTDADRSVRTVREATVQSVEAPPPNDPVVNSVMAQFAKLQKDVAQRRRRKAP